VKTSIHSEASDEVVHSKKGNKDKNDGSPSLMTVEHIQDLIANTIKVQLGGVPVKPTYIPNLTPRELTHSA